MEAPAVRPVRYFANPVGWAAWTLAWSCYVLFFSAVWGPLVAWKIVLGVILHMGLGIGLAVGDLPDRSIHGPRRVFRRGLRTAQARARWPMSRRIAAFVSGILLCALGIGQSLGIEVDIRLYPLISGLCMIVSVAIGLPLVIIASQSGEGPARPDSSSRS